MVVLVVVVEGVCRVFCVSVFVVVVVLLLRSVRVECECVTTGEFVIVVLLGTSRVSLFAFVTHTLRR